jgi:hypothetical protein
MRAEVMLLGVKVGKNDGVKVRKYDRLRGSRCLPGIRGGEKNGVFLRSEKG